MAFFRNTPILLVFAGEPAADIDPRIYGSFVEHLGCCVYTWIDEPGHS